MSRSLTGVGTGVLSERIGSVQRRHGSAIILTAYLVGAIIRLKSDGFRVQGEQPVHDRFSDNARVG